MLHNVKHMAGDFEQLVLFSIFRLGPDAYGATIKRDIEARTGRSLGISAVYVTIARLEAKKLVRTFTGEPRRRNHGVSNRSSRPSTMPRNARYDSRTTRTPAGSSFTCLRRRPPRSAVGSPVNVRTSFFASRREMVT